MVALKILVILTFGFILYQDVKTREVYWFLFPILALCSGGLYFFNTSFEVFFISVMVNMTLVSILLLMVFLYTKLKLKTTFKNAFGLGDVLFFFAIAFSFSTISFIIIFIGALIFSLVLHLAIKNRDSTVPLAGYLSLFFAITYLGYWSGFIQSVYQI